MVREVVGDAYELRENKQDLEHPLKPRDGK